MPRFSPPILPTIAITGIGLTAPGANTPEDFRRQVLAGKSELRRVHRAHVGSVLAGLCDFDPLKHQNKKSLARGTRAGSIAIHCAKQALKSSRLSVNASNTNAIGVFIGVAEHGNLDTENELARLAENHYDTATFSHHHNPRVISNNPAGELTIKLGIQGPHYILGGACAAGNIALIQGAQMLQLGACDIALAGGVSESSQGFGIFAGFRSQLALAEHADPTRACRPFDKDRNGTIVAEGGCIFVLERLSDVKKRNGSVLACLHSWHINSDACHAVHPNAKRQAECMQSALDKGRLRPEAIDLISTHATGTPEGDRAEAQALCEVFANTSAAINNTKSSIGHTMGASAALELAGNLASFNDKVAHPSTNYDTPDPSCPLPQKPSKEAQKLPKADFILNNSFGMLGINSVVIASHPRIQ